MVSTNIWKKKTENTGEEVDEKDRRRKDSRESSIQEILEVEESIWEGRTGKNVYQEAIGPCNRVKRGICAKEKERKSVFTVKREKRRDTSICGGPTVKRIYPAIKITTNLTSPFCSKKGW